MACSNASWWRAMFNRRKSNAYTCLYRVPTDVAAQCTRLMHRQGLQARKCVLKASWAQCVVQDDWKLIAACDIDTQVKRNILLPVL
eukprot:1147819-Pelagomonas_calceolata.AAC.1